MKSSRPLFTKPCELLMTDEKNGVNSDFQNGGLKWIFRKQCYSGISKNVILGLL